MTIKVGDRLPEGTLSEFIEVEGNGCSVGPNQFKVEDLTKGKKVVFFGLPGAFTPTCSAKHVPSYIANSEKLKALGVDAVYCISVNDPFVMGAWGRDQKAGDKVHMMADGSAEYTKKLGLELDLTGRGMGVRCQRFSMLVDDGVVKALNIEAPGKYEGLRRGDDADAARLAALASYFATLTGALHPGLVMAGNEARIGETCRRG
jgi:peroxiredoxin